MQDAHSQRTPHRGLVFLASLLVSWPSTWVGPQVRLGLALLAVALHVGFKVLGQRMLFAILAGFLASALAAAFGRTRLTDFAREIGLGAFLLTCYILNGFAAASRREEEAIRREARRFRGLVESAQEGVWVFDSAWRTVYVNIRMADLLGYLPRELIGREFRDFLADGARLDSLPDLARRDQEFTERHELRFRRSDGSRLWATVTARPILEEGEDPQGMLVMVEDATERKNAERERNLALRALRASEARHGRLVGSNIIGIITADLSGDVLEANDAFLRLVGYSREDLGHRRVRWSDMTPPEFREADQDAINQLWGSGACSPYEKQFFRKDGTTVPVLVGAASLERYPRTWIGFVLDLSERKRVERALEEAKETAESASRAKDAFLAMLSHELRTPLTPVLLLATEMLEDPAIPAEFRPMLETTRRNVELEARLIDDLLDLTRISRGKLQLNREVVDAHALIEQALEICRGEIVASGLRLVLVLSAQEHHVDADPARLQQVFWNLIKNAVKFTPAGGCLTIRSTEGAAPPDDVGARPRLRVEVSDTGIGIGPDVLPRIFDAFEQGDPSTRRKHGGLGLGLAISRSVVEAHGGELVAVSAGAGLGSTFTLELATVPAALVKSPARGTQPEPATPRRPLRILLVEDNKDTLRYLSWILTRHQHLVMTAENLASALETARSETFDLIISDIELPDGSGLELMSRLGGGERPPGIALSGFGSDDDIQLSKAAGFAEHLTKPVDILKLEETIRQIITAADSDERAS